MHPAGGSDDKFYNLQVPNPELNDRDKEKQEFAIQEEEHLQVDDNDDFYNTDGGEKEGIETPRYPCRDRKPPKRQ